MKWYDNLYIGEKALNSSKDIINKIKSRKFQMDIYVLTTSSTDKNIMDIYPSYVLLQKYFFKTDIIILGIAKGREEAMGLMQNIIMEVYNATGNFDIKQYITG
ncbi:MAG: hypothetical protein ACI4DS_06550 [Eubacterium sp.]